MSASRDRAQGYYFIFPEKTVRIEHANCAPDEFDMRSDDNPEDESKHADEGLILFLEDVLEWFKRENIAVNDIPKEVIVAFKTIRDFIEGDE